MAAEASTALARIAARYGMEKAAKEMDAEARSARLQQQARPLLTAFKAWLDAQRLALYVPRLHDTVWSIDFMSDALACGRRCRTFNVLDDFTSMRCSELQHLLPSC